MSTKAAASPSADTFDPIAMALAIVGGGLGLFLALALKDHWGFTGAGWGAVFGGIGGGAGAAAVRLVYQCIRTKILFYAVTIFISAFLVFQIQPIVGKFILPWFGGAPGVWSTVMLFFSTLLLAGYTYAHLLATYCDEHKQGAVHLGVIGVALVMLALFFPPGSTWKPAGDANPSLGILILLTATVGLPYVLLSSTGPLIQKWFSETNPGTSPYRLYALSNVGSLLGLVTYPFLFEPVFPLHEQATGWSVTYGVFAVCCGVCAWRMVTFHKSRLQEQAESRDTRTQRGKERRDQPDTVDKADRPAAAAVAKRPSLYDMALWLALAATGSALMVATNHQLCMDVAAVPFLFVLVLSLYLLTFIICFDNPAWYSRTWFAMALVVTLISTVIVVKEGVSLDDLEIAYWPWSAEEPFVVSSLKLQIIVYSFMLFVGCMVCHGELVQLKPEPKYLTLFFLMVSLGGALGNMLVSLVAPYVFTGFWEYHICLAAVPALLGLVAMRDVLANLAQRRPTYEWSLIGVVGFAAIVGISKLTSTLLADVADTRNGVVDMTRNFYGVLKVTEDRDDSDPSLPPNRYTLTNGRILHGFQFTDENKRNYSTTYYSPLSGVGAAVIQNPHRLKPPGNLRIGVVGLGTGTMATYAEKGDYLRFYDINPAVIHLANTRFTYLQGARDRGADVDVFLGDARLVMERQIKEGNSQQFDVLAIDAFSSDAIPVHLLTKECSAIYWQELKPDGILAIHVSNRYLRLARIVRKLAELEDKECIRIQNSEDDEMGYFLSDWILVTSNQAFLNSPDVIEMEDEFDDDKTVLWTDDFSNLLEVLEE